MIKRLAMTAVIVSVVALGGATVIGTGLDLVRARAESAIWRQRLADLAGQHERLVDRYNDAVRRTAVTELVVRPPERTFSDAEDEGVERDRLAVRVRSVDGVEREIPTDFDPRAEIYIDFVVIDGRVLIRRLFDEFTPPADGLVIDSSLGDIDWEAENATVGKAVYRSLTPGRWTITVNGSGAIDLKRSGEVDAPPAALEAVATIEPFDEIERDIAAARSAIGWRDVWGWIRGAEPVAVPTGEADAAPEA